MLVPVSSAQENARGLVREPIVRKGYNPEEHKKLHNPSSLLKLLPDRGRVVQADKIGVEISMHVQHQLTYLGKLTQT